jgi:hypothetical protein
MELNEVISRLKGVIKEVEILEDSYLASIPYDNGHSAHELTPIN